MYIYLIMKYFRWEGDNYPVYAFSTLEKAEAGKRTLEKDSDWNKDKDYYYEIVKLRLYQ